MSHSEPSPYHCPTCKSASSTVNPRNLVVFIDGTSNKPGPEKTNVKKLHDVLTNDEHKQRKCYIEGIGAYDVPPGAIKNNFEMAVARNVEKNVTDAYKWLARTYQDGDRIYFFGFSRGAYQVRALAGIIHEVGLLQESEVKEERFDQAYRRYMSIDPNNPKTRDAAIQFKKDFCRQGVRVHFVGVWDTVSSLDLVKRVVHVTASASVTNACHFRHALALDEHRVKFMPEYFSEVNALRNDIRSPRAPRTAISDGQEVDDGQEVGDVKEVWFAGGHADVGGMSRPRPHTEGALNLTDDESHPVHSGNVPLVWMRREAADRGLLVDPVTSAWHLEDIDFGREDIDTMPLYCRILEVIPVYHQVSFSGTGKHERRKHGFHPRSVIPTQQIHCSVLPGDMYTPRGILAHRVDIPTVPQKPSGGLSPTKLWTTELLNEKTITSRLESLLDNPHKTLQSLGEVLLLLDFRLDNGQTQIISKPVWPERSSDFDKFALTVLQYVVSGFTAPEEQVTTARNVLDAILPDPNHSDFQRALYIVRFLAKHRDPRRQFIAHDEVIRALVVALDKVPMSRNKDVFPLVTDSLCHLIDDDRVIRQLTDVLNGARLLSALEVKAPASNHLVAALKMIASLAKHLDQPGAREVLQPKIIELAKQGRGPVGSAAVEALVALNVPLGSRVHSHVLRHLPGAVVRGIHISSILSYLGNTLPRLDAEIDTSSRDNGELPLPPVLKRGGSEGLDEELMQKIVSTISSWNAHQSTVATLTLLKLCNNSAVRNYCTRSKVLNIFVKQLEQKKSSLRAAYALMTCLRHAMWTSEDLSRAHAPQLIVAMLDKGWFDDAVGRVEGSKIFGELVASYRLMDEALKTNIAGILQKQLESGDRDKTRMSLICLKALCGPDPARLETIVDDSLEYLKNPDENVQTKGARILSALARTKVGEKAILPRVTEIVRMLLPPSEGPLQPRSQLFGPTAAVYGLCRDETLRELIKNSAEFKTLKDLRHTSNLYPPSATTRST